MYDAIIVGARCAGAPLAMLLARQGAKVLLVDRARFPRDIPHGHFIHRHGPQRLRDWGLLDKVAARTPAISNMIFDLGDFPLLARNLVEEGVAWGYGPRRTTLDKILVDAAVNSGAVLREAFTVDDYVFDDGRMVGIRGRGPDGREVVERGTLTVGAHGRNFKLARTLQAPVCNQLPPILCYYFSYWSGVDAEDFELYVRNERRVVIFAFKTENDLSAIFVGRPMEELPQVRRNIEGSFTRALETVPHFAERVRAGRREERLYGASDLPNFYRKALWSRMGPGRRRRASQGPLLDARHLRMRCATWSSWPALSVRDERGSCRCCKRWRDMRYGEMRLRRVIYEENLAAARFTPPPPGLLAIRAAVRNTPEEATPLMKARQGMIDRGEFFSPQNVQRLLGRAQPGST
jgi:2-polyprenyl-6-methoxyphenol hydroxylase-like FAD-dependent oxidoreductase